MPRIARLFVYPVKSLDATEVTEATLLPSGALAHDRAYALTDSDARFVNAKRLATIHGLRSRYDIATRSLTLRDEAGRGCGECTFDLGGDPTALRAYLAAYFGFNVDVQENRETGFPDDLESPGPTIISTATLREVASWFVLPIDDVRRRFRANIEIDDVPPFWEDRLFGPDGTRVPVSIGSQTLLGINPCQRCIVPTRDPSTGRGNPDFVHRFTAQRRALLPPWTSRDRFNHFYRLAINTRLERWVTPGKIYVGDALELVTAPSSADITEAGGLV